MPAPKGLDLLTSKDEIRDLCYRYARGSDRLDAETFASAFWEDGGFNTPSGGEPFATFADALAVIMGEHFQLTHHLNGNVLIEFSDEDHASTEAYFCAFHLTKPDMTPDQLRFIIGERRLTELAHREGDVYDIVVGGRYLDQLERRDGSWRITLRRLIFDY